MSLNGELPPYDGAKEYSKDFLKSQLPSQDSPLSLENVVQSVKQPASIKQISSIPKSAVLGDPGISKEKAITGVKRQIRANPQAVKDSIKESQREIDTLLSRNDLKHFSPLLRDLRLESEKILRSIESPNATQNFNLEQSVLNFRNSFEQLARNINTWDSDALLTPDQVMSCASDYSILSDESVSTFAADVTGISQERLQVQRFVAHSFGLPTFNIEVQEVPKGLTSGTMGEQVYRVFDKSSKKMVCIIKIKDPQTVTDEVNALRLMHKQKMAFCHFPDVIGLGKCKTAEQKEVLLFAQPVAPGRSIDAYFKELAETSDPKEKKDCQERVTRATISMAKGMADLHNQTINSSITAPYSVNLQHFKDELDENLTKMEAEKLASESTIEKIRKRNDDYSFSPESSSIVHGDFHPGNAFFLDDPPLFTMVDNDNIIQSLDMYKFATGAASAEFAYCHQWIFVLGTLNGIDSTITSNLAEEFEKTYLEDKVSSTGSLQEEVKYMKMYNTVKYIALLSEVLKNTSHPWYQVLGSEKLIALRNILIQELQAYAS